MRILFVHEVSYLRKVGYEIHEFPELLSLRGHDVTFVEFDEGAKNSDLGNPRNRMISGKIHKNSKLRLVTPHRFGIGFMDRLWAIVSCIPVFWRLLSKGRFDAVLNYAVPTYGLQLNLMAKLFKVPVMHRALDVSNQIRKSSWNWLVYLVEGIVFRLSDAVSANNPAMFEYVKSRVPKRMHSKIVIHYPPLDTEIFKPQNPDLSLFRELKFEKGDKILAYMGTFFRFSGLDDFLVRLADFISEDRSIKLMLIGGGELEPELRKICKKAGIGENVVFTGVVPFHDLTKYMTLAAVGINPFRKLEVTRFAFPHKVLQYMAVGLPVISTKLDGLYAAFGDRAGIYWADETSELVTQSLRLASLSSSERDSISKVQLGIVTQMFSVEATVSAVELSLKELSERGY